VKKVMKGKIRGQGKGLWLTGALLTGIIIAVPLSGCGNSGGSAAGAAGNPSDTVATVGSQAIKRNELDTYLETVYGETALQQIIDYELVMQKLKASGLDVTDDEVNKAIDDQSKQNPQVAAMMKAGGPRKDAMVRGTRNQLAIDKLLTKDIKVTDQQLQTWFNKNRARYDQPQRVKIGFLVTSTKVRADTMAQQLKSQSKTFKQLVDEQAKANDPVAGRSVEETEIPMASLPPNMKSALAKLKPNEVTPVITIGSPPRALYLIAHLVANEPSQKADFNQMKTRLEQDYKLEQVMMRSAGSAAGNPNFQPQQGLQQAAGDLLSQLRTDAAKGKQVQVSDPNFEAVSKNFEAAANAPSGLTAPGGAGSATGGVAPSGAAPSGAAPSGAAPAAGAPKAGGAAKPGG